MWQTPETFKYITDSMISNHQSISTMEILVLLMGSTPDTFRYIINLMNSRCQWEKFEDWQLSKVRTHLYIYIYISLIQWQVITCQFQCEIFLSWWWDQLRWHLQINHRFNDLQSPFNFIVRNFIIIIIMSCYQHGYSWPFASSWSSGLHSLSAVY